MKSNYEMLYPLMLVQYIFYTMLPLPRALNIACDNDDESIYLILLLGVIKTRRSSNHRLFYLFNLEYRQGVN